MNFVHIFNTYLDISDVLHKNDDLLIEPRITKCLHVPFCKFRSRILNNIVVSLILKIRFFPVILTKSKNE